MVKDKALLIIGSCTGLLYIYFSFVDSYPKSFVYGKWYLGVIIIIVSILVFLYLNKSEESDN